MSSTEERGQALLPYLEVTEILPIYQNQARFGTTPSLTVGLLPRHTAGLGLVARTPRYEIKLEKRVAKIIPRINARIQSSIATLQPALELTLVPALANAFALNQSP
jgi:hypothetical protein